MRKPARQIVRRDWWRFAVFASPTRAPHPTRTIQVAVVIEHREYRVIYRRKGWVE